MSWWGDLLRRARIRGLVEGVVQRGRTEATEHDAKDEAERWQDYGFSAQPVDGQGLVINAGGHTIVLRMDRLAERPQLAAYEVAVWHKEGHRVTLRAGKLVQVSCDRLVIDAAVSVAINSPSVAIAASSGVSVETPLVAMSADLSIGGTGTAGVDVVAAGVSLVEHPHGGVKMGTDTSGPPVS
jgi:phage baseplate assembly protein V